MRHRLRIRIGRTSDANRLAVLAAQVWLHTYATDGIGDEIAQYVLSELTPEKYLQSLSEPTTRFFVAEHDDCLVGFAVVKFGVPCPSGANSATELQTLYVQEHHMGHGIGKSLLRAAEAEAREQSESALWLTVNAKNARAIAFYAHQGYLKVGTSYFVLGEGRHENHVLIGPHEPPASRKPAAMPTVEELLALDLLTLREHTELAGDVLDPEGQRSAIERSLAVSELAAVRRDGRLVAYAMLQPQEAGRWFVTGFNTHPAHRSAPVFRDLFAQISTVAARHGISSLRSNVYKTNRLSMAFHRRLGFKVTRENAKGVEFTASVADLAASHLVNLTVRQS